jgi:hypothetical protein
MKNIQKFMICSNIFAPGDYRSLYRIDPDSCVRIVEYRPTFDLSQPRSDEFDLPLPKELVYLILDNLILRYMKESSFELAIQLICFDESTMRRFYMKYFHDNELYMPFRMILHRLSRSFSLMQRVCDGVIQFPNEEHDHYIGLDLQFTGTYRPGKCYNPWNFNGMVNIIQIPKPGIFGIEDFRGFVTGPYITDVVWMSGQNQRGIVYSDFYRLPVLVFVFTDEDGNIIPTRLELMKHKPFQTFAKFLKLAFGPTTGVFFAVQGHFIFDDQILLEL